MTDVKPRLLDLFCGAGEGRDGLSLGRASRWSGWISGRSRTTRSTFLLGDALATLDGIGFDLGGFAAIHASPPCQAFTDYKRAGNVKRLTRPDPGRHGSCSLPAACRM
jgi:hypothetical protein